MLPKQASVESITFVPDTAVVILILSLSPLNAFS